MRLLPRLEPRAPRPAEAAAPIPASRYARDRRHPASRIGLTRARARPATPGGPRSVAAASSGSNRRPASPATSGSAPRFATTTGTPTVIASSTGMPKPSVCDGMMKTSARRYSASRASVVDVAGQFDVAGQRRPRRPATAPAGRPRLRRPAGEDQRRGVRHGAQQPFVRVQQHAQILARFERAEEEQAAARRLLLPPLPGRGARRADADARRRARPCGCAPRRPSRAKSRRRGARAGRGSARARGSRAGSPGTVRSG